MSEQTAIVKAEDDTLSSSPCDLTAIDKMSADELHREIIQTYVALGENVVMYQALVLSARERMHRGEKIGGCLTWTEYADEYLRRDGESLPTCLRRLARAIEGHNPDTKHDGSKGRKKSKSAEKSELKEVTGKCQARKPDHRMCGAPADIVLTCGMGEDKFCWKHFSDKNGLGEYVQKQLAPPSLPEPTLVPDEKRDEIEEQIEVIKGILENKSGDTYWTKRLKESEQLLSGFDEDEERESLPAYTVTLHAKSITSMKAQLRKLGIEATVEKIVRASSRADVLDQAARQVEDAKQTVEELRDELQEWHDNLPENLQNGEKSSELEETISALEDLSSEIGNIDFDVQFPGMY